MKCPNCLTKINFFSKEILLAGKYSVCKNCLENYKITINFKRYLIAFIPVLLLVFFLINIGFNSFLTTVIALTIMIFFGISIKDENVESINFSVGKGCIYVILGTFFLIVTIFAVVALLSAFLG